MKFEYFIRGNYWRVFSLHFLLLSFLLIGLLSCQKKEVSNEISKQEKVPPEIEISEADHLSENESINNIAPRGEDLIRFAEIGNLKAVKRLIAAGVDVNYKHGSGAVALMYASENGYVEIVQILLENGADVNAQDGRWQSSLAYASWSGNLLIVEILLDAGADVQVADFMGNTPLGCAQSGGYTEIVELLESVGALPDCSSEFSM